MSKPNLRSIYSNGKSSVAQASGALENVLGAAGTGGFSVSASPNGLSVSANFNQLLQKRKYGNRVITQLKDLYDPSKGGVHQPIVFPADLDNEHYMIYNVVERKRLSADKSLENRVIRSIVLPIPSNLTVNYGAEYSTESLGIFGAAAADRFVAPASFMDNDITQAILSRIKTAQQALTTGDQDAITQSIGVLGPAAVTTVAALGGGGLLGGALALGGTAGGVISGISVSEGLALNPHMATIFHGSTFREHAFSYKLVARNQTESDRIRSLIAVLKYHMHPGYSAGTLAFTYPDEFKIQFSDALAPYLYKIETCVLKNLSVNYNGEHIPLFFESTGAPVAIEIGMTFQETERLTRENLDSGTEDGETEYRIQ